METVKKVYDKKNMNAKLSVLIAGLTAGTAITVASGKKSTYVQK